MGVAKKKDKRKNNT